MTDSIALASDLRGQGFKAEDGFRCTSYIRKFKIGGSVRVQIEEGTYVNVFVFDEHMVVRYQASFADAPADLIMRTVDYALSSVRAEMIPVD